MRQIPTVTGTTFGVNFDGIDDWAQIQHTLDHKLGHQYTAVRADTGEPVGSLRYILDYPTPGLVTIHELEVDPGYRHRGVGYALIVRLHADHPDHKVDPSFPAETGMDFMCSIMVTEPQVLIAVHLQPGVEEAVRKHRLTSHLFA